jgi:hypothetical protein
VGEHERSRSSPLVGRKEQQRSVEVQDDDRREVEDFAALVPDERTSRRRHMTLVTSAR